MTKNNNMPDELIVWEDEKNPYTYLGDARMHIAGTRYIKAPTEGECDRCGGNDMVKRVERYFNPKAPTEGECDDLMLAYQKGVEDIKADIRQGQQDALDALDSLWLIAHNHTKNNNTIQGDNTVVKNCYDFIRKHIGGE